MIESSATPHDAVTESRLGSHRDRPWGPILVGTDGSEGAARAVNAAAVLAAELNTNLWIALVIERPSETDLTHFAHAEEASIGDVAEAVARRILNDAARRAETAGARKVYTVLRSGDSAEELVAAARQFSAAATVVGRRGTGGRLSQALVGSVSQKLAGISPTMLVIVP